MLYTFHFLLDKKEKIEYRIIMLEENSVFENFVIDTDIDIGIKTKIIPDVRMSVNQQNENKFILETLEGKDSKEVYKQDHPDATSKSVAESVSRKKRKILEQCERIFQRYAKKEIKRLVELSEQGENLTVSLGAVNSMLDRAGLKAIEKVDVRKVNLDIKDIETIAKFLQATGG